MEASTVKEVLCLVLRHTSILQRVLHSILASLLGLLMAHALRLACSRCSHIGARGLQASIAIYGLESQRTCVAAAMPATLAASEAASPA